MGRAVLVKLVAWIGVLSKSTGKLARYWDWEEKTMANEEHLAILKQGVEVWNEWREENPDVRPDLSQAYLRWADLSGADLGWAYLRRADLLVPRKPAQLVQGQMQA